MNELTIYSKKRSPKVSTKRRSTKKRSTKKRSTKKRSNKKRSTKERSTKKRSNKKSFTKKRSTKKRSNNRRSSKKRSSKKRSTRETIKPTEKDIIKDLNDLDDEIHNILVEVIGSKGGSAKDYLELNDNNRYSIPGYSSLRNYIKELKIFKLIGNSIK